MIKSVFLIPATTGRDWCVRMGALTGALLGLGLLAETARAAEDDPGVAAFHAEIQPLLEDYCYGCHGYGLKTADVGFDSFDSVEDLIAERELWDKALRQLRAHLMPPPEEEFRPTDEERERIAAWIKSAVFGIDPEHPDPGRVTLRRLNRVEYRNTVRDLIGVDFDTEAAFPPDDTGHGFDNIGDVLTISPLLMEKYIDAANTIIGEAVPTAPWVVAEQTIPGSRFRIEDISEDPEDSERDRGSRRRRGLALSYYEPATAVAEHEVALGGDYELLVHLRARERYVDGVFDSNECRLRFFVDGEELLSETFVRQGGRPYEFAFDLNWDPGVHELKFEVEPLTPDAEQVRSLTIQVEDVTVRGPLDEEHRVRPPRYEEFFPEAIPEDPEARLALARSLLEDFATRAFRRPPSPETLDRLVEIVEVVSSQAGATFEAGVAQGMTAILASPRFLFREEEFDPSSTDRYPLIDEDALASRLSYFLWSTMPDEELFELAARNELRNNLDEQVERMLDDSKSEAFVRHFVGQWLRARSIESVPINARAVIRREQPPDPEAERRRERFRELRRKDDDELTDEEREELQEIRRAFFASFRRFRQYELDRDLRRAMRRETELLFEHVLREDRSLLELLDSDYTFLNERLAAHYELEGVALDGDRMVRVELPEDSPRGGVLTQGTVLVVTSNPDRTSPVKRGLFILENLLGVPPAPPPPDIPALEEADEQFEDREPTLREALELHRAQPTCSSCHDRMDPLGLAFENFNALGRWRELEREQPIDASGELVTGETFAGASELKRILAENHRDAFYRCVTEKLLTYALGRGLEPVDVHTVDEIVAELERTGGRASVLLEGVIHSAPFQRMRRPEDEAARVTLGPAERRRRGEPPSDPPPPPDPVNDPPTLQGAEP